MTARHEWLLLALAHRNGAPLTPVQVQKAMFLLGKEAPTKVGAEFYSFEPYNYGPFDADVYLDLEKMAKDGLVSIDGASRWRSYSATPTGIIEAKKLEAGLDANSREFIARLVDWVASLDFADLVRAVYEKYPEYRANSVFVG